jgi:cell division septum initiation protein DivIVA
MSNARDLLAAFEQELTSTEQKIAAAKTQLNAIESTLRDTTVQQTDIQKALLRSREELENAQGEAKRLLKDANARAAAVVGEADRKAQAILADAERRISEGAARIREAGELMTRKVN